MRTVYNIECHTLNFQLIYFLYENTKINNNGNKRKLFYRQSAYKIGHLHNQKMIDRWVN